MTLSHTLSRQVQDEVSRWEGVVTRPHRFGGVEFRLGERDFGHIHLSNAMLDVPFPKKIGQQLVTEGRTKPHHLFPQTGWTTFYVTSEEEVSGAVWLLRLSYLTNLIRQPNRAPNVNGTDELAALRLSPELDAAFEHLRSRRKPPTITRSES